MAGGKLSAPTYKVAVPTLAGAIATLAAALIQHKTINPYSVALAGFTVGQAVLGYLSPAKPVPTPKPPVRRRRRPPAPPPKFLTLFDTVTPSAIGRLLSTSTDAVAGYDDGLYNDIAALARDYPAHRHFSIAVTARDNADFLDVETGDATPLEVPAWCGRQWARGARLVGVYANASTWPQIETALTTAGLDRRRIVKWVADWTSSPHIPRGFDGCQWTDHGPQGQNVDESLFYTSSLNGHPV